MERKVLESSKLLYVQDDHLIIECVIDVVVGPRLSAPTALSMIEPPPPAILDVLGRLLEEKKGTDVTFNV